MVIDSEVIDENKLSNSTCDFDNKELQNNNTLITCSEQHNLGSDVEDIELDVLQEDDLKLLKILISSSLTGSSSKLFLH